jgi:hypothetical protein
VIKLSTFSVYLYTFGGLKKFSCYFSKFAIIYDLAWGRSDRSFSISALALFCLYPCGCVAAPYIYGVACTAFSVPPFLFWLCSPRRAAPRSSMGVYEFPRIFPAAECADAD